MSSFVDIQDENRVRTDMKLIMLHEFALLLNSSYSIEKILQESVKKIREVTRSDGCHIMFSQCLIDSLELTTAIHDTDIPLPPNVDLTKGKVAQETFLTKQIIIIDDTMSDPRIIQKARDIIGHRSMVAVPVMVKGEAIGVIVVYSKHLANFHQGDARFLMMLGNHLGLAVENSRLMMELKKTAIMDSLTGAYNHRYLRSQLAALVENHEQVISLIMIDVDSFKAINDNYGHLAGDYVLQEVTRILKSIVRKEDIVIRYGGDEFAVVLPHADFDETKVIGARIEQSVACEDFYFGEEHFNVTLSWGAVTLTPKDINCINDIIKQADLKLYKMKNKKKNSRFQRKISVNGN